MNIWLKELSENDDKIYFDLLVELAGYKDAYARPVPEDFSYSEYEYFKKCRINMKNGVNLPSYATTTSTYWVMDGEIPIGYATLKHKVDPSKPGGHFGLCLKREYQNRGIGTIVSNLLSDIAYNELGIDEIIFTSKDENIQSQKSVAKIGAKLIGIHDGYHFYSYSLRKKYENSSKKKL